MIGLIDAVTNVALGHEEMCDCVVCRAAAGDRDAMEECIAARARALNAHRPTPSRKDANA
jgi:hypothetical protein